jgi:hypothetical protein
MNADALASATGHNKVVEMSFKKFALAALLAGCAFAAPAHATVYDFTFLSNDNVLNITDGTFTTDAANNILSASGTLTSTNAALLGGVNSLSFSLAGLGSGGADSQIWTNIWDPVNNIFSGAGLGLLLSNGQYSSLYDVSGYPACPGQTCISVDPTTNGTDWDPGDPGVLSVQDPPSGVPEPATWAMMLMGFAGIGTMLRTGRKQAVTA